MHVDRFTWERALRDESTPATRKLVLFVLASYMNADGTGARPGVAKLCDATGLKDSAVRRHLAAACEDGWLEQVARGHRRGDGVARASEYRARVPISTGTGAPVEHEVDDISTGTGVPVDESSTGTSDVLNRYVEASQPVPPYRLPSHYHQVTTTTPRPRAEIRSEAERIARTERAAGKDIANFRRYVDGIAQRLIDEQQQIEAAERARAERDRRANCGCAGGWTGLNNAGSAVPCPTCNPLAIAR